jgi:glycosyltransferase involved in cell wall biosynthesis
MWHAKGVLARLQASRVMTISQTSAGEIVQHLGVPADRIDLVTEGPGEAFQPNTDSQQLCRTLEKYGLSEKHDLLVYLGGMNRHKNVQALLQAMQRVVAEAPNTHLVIIGDVTDKGFWTDANRLQAMVADCPILKEHAHFTGYLPDREAAKLLNAAKALVFPSLAEGFGLPAVEAMACGTPVLSSDRGSLPEVVGDAGLYFNPEDVEDMAAQILGFLRDEGLQTRLSRLALERSGNFTWARAAELAESSFRRSLKKVRVDKFRG